MRSSRTFVGTAAALLIGCAAAIFAEDRNAPAGANAPAATVYTIAVSGTS
jgi:hypothetical protein